MKRYHRAREQANAVASPAELTLRDMILSHLSEWNPRLVDGKIEEFLGRKRYKQHGSQGAKRHRNGYYKECFLTCGMGTFPVRLARLRELFESQLVQLY